MKTKIKHALKKIFHGVSSILAGVFIILATIATIYYANGYRFGNSGKIEKTGVLILKSNPSRSDIDINGISDGKTTKTFSSLYGDIDYLVEVSRDGYHTWSKRVSIKVEKSTPLFAYLFKTAPDKTEEIGIDGEIVAIDHTLDQRYILTLTKETPMIPGEDGISVPDEANSMYRLWRYSVNPKFWELSNNPILLTEQKFGNASEIVMQISPDSERTLLTVSNLEEVNTEEPSTDPIITTKSYIIDNSEQTNSLSEINLSSFYESYTIDWSEDGKYLMLESNSETLSVETESETKVLLVKKDDNNKDLVWSTDLEGNFYHIQYEFDENNKEYAQIVQQSLNGSKTTQLLDRIYFQDSPENIKGELEDQQTPFTNSPENGRFVGRITALDILDNGKSLVMETEYALYWYDIDEEKYILVSNVPSEYLASNHNETKFSFLTSEETNRLGIFTFNKDDEDHTETITTLFTLESNTAEAFYWHSNSEYIFFKDGSRINVMDDEGENIFTLFDTETYFYVPSDSSEDIAILESTKDPISDEVTSNQMVKYKIH